MTRTADVKGISISVMGREFRVAAPPGEARQLLASVDLLNRKMKEIRDTGKVVGNERIAIMAALNLAHENLHTPGAAITNPRNERESPPSSTVSTIDEAYVKSRIALFESILEKAVAEQEKLF
ncbi:MAG: cell division protein ZapA [Burkholderiales bacterium]